MSHVTFFPFYSGNIHSLCFVQLIYYLSLLCCCCLGNHVILPVYVAPTQPCDGHTPIIITQTGKEEISKEVGQDGQAANSHCVQIQENVDNVLHEETVQLNQAALDLSNVAIAGSVREVGVEIEEECLVQEEFVPFENMADEDLLLGPWGEVLTRMVGDRGEMNTVLDLFSPEDEEEAAAMLDEDVLVLQSGLATPLLKEKDKGKSIMIVCVYVCV